MLRVSTPKKVGGGGGEGEEVVANRTKKVMNLPVRNLVPNFSRWIRRFTNHKACEVQVHLFTLIPLQYNNNKE